MARVKDEALFSLLRDYLTIYLLNQRKSSPNTVKAYRSAWNQFLKYLAAENKVRIIEVSFEMINKDSVSGYLTWLSEKKQATVTTKNNRLAAIRAFIDYASACRPEYISLYNGLATIKIQKVVRFSKLDYMSEDAIAALLKVPDTKTREGLRDQVFMIFLYDTGARIQEVLNVRLCDLKFGTTPTVTLFGKGRKTRIVPLMEGTVDHLKNYLSVFHENEPLESKEYLFYVTRKGKRHPVNDDTARIRLRKYVGPAKALCREVPDNIHPHLWRHSRAMHLYQHGMDLTMVSQWLGHSNLETTEIYAYADTEAKRKAIERAVGSKSSAGASPKYAISDEDLLQKLYGL